MKLINFYDTVEHAYADTVEQDLDTCIPVLKIKSIRTNSCMLRKCLCHSQNCRPFLTHRLNKGCGVGQYCHDIEI